MPTYHEQTTRFAKSGIRIPREAPLLGGWLGSKVVGRSPQHQRAGIAGWGSGTPFLLKSIRAHLFDYCLQRSARYC